MWEKGNVLLFRMVSVRPDQKCMEVDQETIVKLVERCMQWTVRTVGVQH